MVSHCQQYIFFTSIDRSGINNVMEDLKAAQLLVLILSWQAESNVWSKWVSICVCWYILMRSPKGGIDGWHSIISLQDPKANLLLLLNTSSSSTFSSCIPFYSLYLIPHDFQPSVSCLCPFLTDLFIPRIPSLPSVHSTIYFSSLLTTRPPHSQSLHPIPISSSSLVFLYLPLIPPFSSPVNSQACLNYFGLYCDGFWCRQVTARDRCLMLSGVSDGRLWTEGRSHPADLMGLSPGWVIMHWRFSGKVDYCAVSLFFNRILLLRHCYIFLLLYILHYHY